MGIQETGSARWCECCGNQFVAFSPRAMYCSDKCKQKMYRKNKSVNSNAKRQPGRPMGNCVCNHCGRRFTAKRSDAKFCSGSCRTMANRNRQRETWLLAKRETVLTDFDIYDVAAHNGWRFWYKQAEEWGYVWIDSKGQYWLKGMAEACLLI